MWLRSYWHRAGPALSQACGKTSDWVVACFRSSLRGATCRLELLRNRRPRARRRCATRSTSSRWARPRASAWSRPTTWSCRWATPGWTRRRRPSSRRAAWPLTGELRLAGFWEPRARCACFTVQLQLTADACLVRGVQACEGWGGFYKRCAGHSLRPCARRVGCISHLCYHHRF